MSMRQHECDEINAERMKNKQIQKKRENKNQVPFKTVDIVIY